MSKKKLDMKKAQLDEEEQVISDSVDQMLDQDDLKTVDDLSEELLFAKKASTNYLRKDARITLRISSNDLEQLKQKAAYKGLPYQTFISSVLHEYAAGHFRSVGE